MAGFFPDSPRTWDKLRRFIGLGDSIFFCFAEQWGGGDPRSLPGDDKHPVETTIHDLVFALKI